MSTIETIHNQAMDLAEQAFTLKKFDQDVKAAEVFKRALRLEQKAAELLPISRRNEPSRSILYRSAASLAYNAKEYDLAERLIANGLAGYPPIEIREELKNLYEDVTFSRHLYIKGQELQDNNWVMSLYGRSTKYGGAAAHHLMMRVDRIQKLFYRTVERMLNVPYRTEAGVSKTIKDSYGLYIDALSPASLAVTFKIGTPNKQLDLWPGSSQNQTVQSNEIIEEISECLELFETDEHEELRSHFSDETYYENFIGLVKDIAPDGNDIQMVGFIALRKGIEKPIPLRKKRKGIKQQYQITIAKDDSSDKHKDMTISLTGVLKHADSLKKQHGIVQLLLADGSTKTIHVPIALMKDVVQPFYEEEVIIQSHMKGKKIILDEIFLSS